jgi:membrane protein YqaA with SNARE-associated domain
MIDYIVLSVIVILINIVPAFAPPTWAVLVLYRITMHLSPVPLVIIGAISACTGRYFLATFTGLLRNKLSENVTKNLDSAKEALTKKFSHKAFGVILFGLSPLPSAQLFEAAGLMKMPLRPLLSAFFFGRLINYGVAVAGATSLESTGMGDLIKKGVSSPWSLLVQIILIYGIYLLTKFDWQKFRSN